MQNRLMAGNLAGAVTARCRTELGELGRATGMARRPDLPMSEHSHQDYAGDPQMPKMSAVAGTHFYSQVGVIIRGKIGLLPVSRDCGPALS